MEELRLSPREGGREGGRSPSIPAAALKGNVPSLSQARRNKYLMGEAIRSAGLRAAKQIQTSSWAEIPPFLATCRKPSLHPSLPPSLKVVLKPLSSAGSDGVFFASSEEEVKEAFDTILSSNNVFGERNTSVLVQEFLRGTEFVVDSISHEGKHRVTAFWRYDKRALNGAAFVYYGLRLFESEGEDEEGKEGGREMEWALARYAHRCLDALGIQNGFSHAELMWLEEEGGREGGVGGEPCLVEVGARPHGGEGTFVSLTEAAIGFNQLSVALDLIEDPCALTALHVLPPRLKAHAAEVCLVSRQAGRLVRHFLEERVNAEVLPSLKVCASGWKGCVACVCVCRDGRGCHDVPFPFPRFFTVTCALSLMRCSTLPPSLHTPPQSVALHVGIGDCLKKTVDMLSSPGSAILCHHDPKVLEEDYETLHAMDNLFLVEENEEGGGEEGTTTTEEGGSSDWRELGGGGRGWGGGGAEGR